MPTDDSTETAPPAAVPAAPAWAPKVADFVYLTETDGRTKKVTTNLFLITGSSIARGPKRDEKGNVIVAPKQMKVGTETRMINQTVLEDIQTFEGLVLSAQMQFTVPKRGILIGALSPLEV